MDFEVVKKGFVKRQMRRSIGLFIDGTGLDRATRRISRKVDMSSLVRGVTSGSPPVVARYYTLIPFEDDSRHRAFLDAVARAGLTVVVKRLPPKGVTRQVSVDIEMAADMVAFALGHSTFSSAHEYDPHDSGTGTSQTNGARGSALPGGLSLRKAVPRTPLLRPSRAPGAPLGTDDSSPPEVAPQGQLVSPIPAESEATEPVDADHSKEAKMATQRIVTVVCPSRDLAYPIGLIKELGVDTVTADFGQFNTGDVLKSAAKWIDLSDSETIWRD